MNPPEGAEAFTRAELCLALPPDWKMSEDDFKDERNYWPVRWLKTLARFPHEYDTWLWWGHSMPNGDPPESIEDTRFTGWLLLSPVLTPEAFDTLTLEDGSEVCFFAPYPVYTEEMDLKLAQGSDEVCERFAKSGVSELIDKSRPNTAKKKLFGLF